MSVFYSARQKISLFNVRPLSKRRFFSHKYLFFTYLCSNRETVRAFLVKWHYLRKRYDSTLSQKDSSCNTPKDYVIGVHIFSKINPLVGLVL